MFKKKKLETEKVIKEEVQIQQPLKPVSEYEYLTAIDILNAAIANRQIYADELIKSEFVLGLGLMGYNHSQTFIYPIGSDIQPPTLQFRGLCALSKTKFRSIESIKEEERKQLSEQVEQLKKTISAKVAELETASKKLGLK